MANRKLLQNTDPVTQPVMQLLTGRNIELEERLASANRTIENQKKELEIIYQSLLRPAVANVTDEQIMILADLIWQRIWNMPIPKKEPVAS